MNDRLETGLGTPHGIRGLAGCQYARLPERRIERIRRAVHDISIA